MLWCFSLLIQLKLTSLVRLQYVKVIHLKWNQMGRCHLTVWVHSASLCLAIALAEQMFGKLTISLLALVFIIGKETFQVQVHSLTKRCFSVSFFFAFNTLSWFSLLWFLLWDIHIEAATCMILRDTTILSYTWTITKFTNAYLCKHEAREILCPHWRIYNKATGKKKVPIIS